MTESSDLFRFRSHLEEYFAVRMREASPCGFQFFGRTPLNSGVHFTPVRHAIEHKDYRKVFEIVLSIEQKQFGEYTLTDWETEQFAAAARKVHMKMRIISTWCIDDEKLLREHIASL